MVLSALPGPTPKGCELPFLLAALGQAIRCWKALNLGSLNMRFRQDWPKDKKITALLNFWRKTEIFARLSFMVRLWRDQPVFVIAAPHAVRKWTAVD